MRNTSDTKSRYFIRSLAKGLRLLQVLAEEGRPLSLSEIAKYMGANKPSVNRLCYTLSTLGFIKRDAYKCYSLTPNILELGYPSICGMGWRDISKYHLRELFEDVDETVSMSVLDGQEIVFIIRFQRQKHLPFDIRMGTKIPVHCTAMGKVLMALGDPAITEPVLEKLDFTPLTVHTITDRERYDEELQWVKEKGYAVNDEEMSLGNRSIAAPVMGENGFAMSAIVIAVPTKRYSVEDLKHRFADKIIQTGQTISESLIKSNVDLSYGTF